MTLPCIKNDELRARIERYAEILKVEAHKLGDHGLDEHEFYNSGLFRGAIERIRGQFSATMREKRDFMNRVLNFMQDQKFIKDWHSSGNSNRHDYEIEFSSGKNCIIELKGCLDGNNITIFERPPHANEFIIWSICTNPASDPRLGAWSGIHTRLSAEIISRNQCVDAVVIWDMMCGTLGRPCPKIERDRRPLTVIGQFQLPPPCIFLLPGTIPSPRNNPHPKAHNSDDLSFVSALKQCFSLEDNDFKFVDFEVKYEDSDILRRTTIHSKTGIERQSDWSAIKRR
ncbi:MAG: hypothetical protein EA385_03140 [Salinarimonadaceae bacterium]|nr:MAG: hypothetical protein EA385_03140 [Salinarimonadaceae bacterium]